jgi:transposase-like protein
MVGRKSLDAETKALIAIEALKGEKTIEQIAAEHGISKSLSRKLKKKLLERAPQLFSKEGELKEEYIKLKELSFESINQQNTQLNSILKGITKSYKVNSITAWSNFAIAIFAVVTVVAYFILAQSNDRLAKYTGNLADHTKKMAKYTEEMSKHNAVMAKLFKEQKDIKEEAKIDVSCIVRSGFKTTLSNKELKFELSDYLKHRGEIQFFFAVKNNGKYSINSELDIPFRIFILNKDNEILETHPTGKDPDWISDFPINVGSKNISEMSEVQELKEKLAKVVVKKNYTDKIIKITIPNSDLKLDGYSYVETKVIFKKYNSSKTSPGIKSE